MDDDRSAHDRDSSARPSAGARRRSVTAGPYRNRLSDVQIAAIEREMTDEYRQHKRPMHKAEHPPPTTPRFGTCASSP